ncbi:MAG: cytochrome C biogenesis protein CycH [Marinilabiliales bacterium]|nr:MAG: cytochrome C biogenesis protein CycH [Marinilabiliales bacterium]
MNKSNIEIYQLEDGRTEINVQLDKETVWLSLNQMVELFERDKSVISRHIGNVFKEGELDRRATVAKYATVQNEGNRKVFRDIDFFNLDVIISVGYIIRSQRGTQFRIWANKILKEYLVQGYALNEKKISNHYEKLKELQESVKILGNVLNYKSLTNNESKGLLQIISDYAYALDVLDQYDYQTLAIENTSGKDSWQITYEEAMAQILMVKKAHGNSDLFGHEKDDSFQSSISTIYQSFDGQDLYPSIEEKAANLLYFITKNHSFSDGNKRIAAFLFLYFLERNCILFDEMGYKRIADNTLVALTLMIAVSKPDEKETMTKVVVNLINRNN